MVTQHYIDKWQERLPNTLPGWQGAQPNQTIPNQLGSLQQYMNPVPGITPEEIKEFHSLLEKAREYDAKNNEPHCELESKRETLRTIAKALGVEIEFL